jgi:hypothetical protein
LLEKYRQSLPTRELLRPVISRLQSAGLAPSREQLEGAVADVQSWAAGLVNRAHEDGGDDVRSCEDANALRTAVRHSCSRYSRGRLTRNKRRWRALTSASAPISVRRNWRVTVQKPVIARRARSDTSIARSCQAKRKGALTRSVRFWRITAFRAKGSRRRQGECGWTAPCMPSRQQLRKPSQPAMRRCRLNKFAMGL